jgi:flagellar biosynthesis/type III secretory pathway M-ring protein FliF/YscJ
VDALAALLVFVVLVAAVAVVIAPLRRGRTEALVTAEETRREELEAAKEAKYLEIRDAEMDFAMSKLSEADFKALDRQLRAEAVEILRELDALS